MGVLLPAIDAVLCTTVHPLDERPQNEQDALEVAWAASALVYILPPDTGGMSRRERRESWKRLDLLEVWRYMLCWRPMEKSKGKLQIRALKACAGAVPKPGPSMLRAQHLSQKLQKVQPGAYWAAVDRESETGP